MLETLSWLLVCSWGSLNVAEVFDAGRSGDLAAGCHRLLIVGRLLTRLVSTAGIQDLRVAATTDGLIPAIARPAGARSDDRATFRRSGGAEDAATSLTSLDVVIDQGSARGMGARCRGDVPEPTVGLPTIDQWLVWREDEAY